jgi:hypothetical protein
MLPTDLDPHSLDPEPPSKAAIRAAGRRAYEVYVVSEHPRISIPWERLPEGEQVRWFAVAHAVLVPERRS